MSDRRQLRAYLLVTLCYWVFTLSDGALRMIVLLHLHDQGETAWGLALILLPYEAAGIATNLLGGFLGARYGLKRTLLLGLLLQAAACGMLAADAAGLTLTFVAATQVLSGIAKDFAKTSAKSYVKVLQPRGGATALYRWVAWLTGGKNTMKGVGFFLGGALLASCGFEAVNAVLALLLLFIAVVAATTLPKMPGAAASSLAEVVRQDAPTWWLSAARVFLFGSRDAWFTVALPLFLVSCGWTPWSGGAALAVWVAGYGLIQAAAPHVTRPANARAGAAAVIRWSGALLLPLAPLAIALPRTQAAVPLLLCGLCAYGAVFAVTSSLHSWLVVGMHDDGRSVERVGFYYAANAVGRLAGTACSGWLFAAAALPETGLAACIAASCVAVAGATACAVPLRRALP